VSKVRVKLSGVPALLKSREVQADLLRRGRAIAVAAGPGHEVEVSVGRSRARCGVWTDTFDAKLDEAKSPRLVAAMNAGRV